MKGKQKISDWVKYLNQRGVRLTMEYTFDASGEVGLKIDKWFVDDDLVREVGNFATGLIEERCRQ